MRKFTVLLSLTILTISPYFTAAQTPQYYNTNAGTGINTYPFGQGGGQRVHWLIRPGELNQPGPCPAGNIITLFFFMGNSASGTFTNLTVRLGQTALTSLPSAWYTGQMDTVYFRASVPLSCTNSAWMSITLDRPFTYNPALSLIIDVSQCAATGLLYVRQSSVSPATRNYGTPGGGCNIAYAGQDGQQINFGVNLNPGPVPRFYNTAWCSGAQYPNIPSATIYNECAWVGDTMYMHTPTNTGAATTTVTRYILATNSWSTGVPLPVAKTQGTMTSAAGKVYYIGGSATPGGGGSTDVYEFNPSTGIWTLKAPLPGSTQGHGAATWGDSVIFVIMGPWNTPSSSCYFYRIGNNTTGTTTSFPGMPTKGHATGLWGNKIYVAGGFGTAYTKQFYIGTIGSDASTISWAAGPPFPSVPKAYLGGTAVGDRFYLVGGNNSIGTTSSDSVFIWFINAGIWAAFPGLKPVAVHNVEAAVTYKIIADTVKIFCPGGSSGTGTTLNTDVIACGPTVTGIEPTLGIPREYALMQNYPNPFNPVTKITYALPKAGIVYLTVYDILGKEVKALVNEFKNPGTYSVYFDADQLASALYLYELKSGEFKDIKKMILLK
jgi:type IX secretion system substrate protein